MILASVRARCKLTYPMGHRQFAEGPNPKTKARIWAGIGVLEQVLRFLACKDVEIELDFQSYTPRH